MLSGLPEYKLIQMIKGSKKQKEEAFNEVFERYASTINAYCKCILKSYQHCENTVNSDDILQETFIRFYNTCISGLEISNLHGYLISTARNLCLNIKRDRKKNIPLDESGLTVNSDKDSYEQKELLELIIISLELVEEIYREVFIMREFDGMSFKEISDRLNISVDNAKVRAVRAKRKLTQILSPYLKDLNKF